MGWKETRVQDERLLLVEEFAAGGRSMRSIAHGLGRAVSTVSREIHRNGGSGCYRASSADHQAWERARRPKSCRLVRCPQLRRLVEEKLREDWSPQQMVVSTARCNTSPRKEK